MIALKKLSDGTRVEFNSIFEVLAKAEYDKINKNLRIGDDYYELDTATDEGTVPNTFEWQDSVKSIVTTPPAEPVRGDRHLIINPDLETEFSDMANMIAERLVNSWEYTAPSIGMAIYVDATKKIYFYNGESWEAQAITIAEGYVTPSMLSTQGLAAGAMLVLTADGELLNWEALPVGAEGTILKIVEGKPTWYAAV